MNLPSASAPTQPTDPAPTAIGVGPGVVDGRHRGDRRERRRRTSPHSVGPFRYPPDKTVAPMTTATTATPARNPERGPAAAAAGRPVRAAPGPPTRVRWRPRCVPTDRAAARAAGRAGRAAGVDRPRRPRPRRDTPHNRQGGRRAMRHPHGSSGPSSRRAASRPGAIVEDDRLARPSPEAMHPAHR